jgi:hypothetical protein
MFVQSELGFRNRGSERLREGFLRNRPGSLNRRVCNGATDCKSTTTILMVNCVMLLRMAAPPSIGCHTCCAYQYNH